MNRMTKRNEDGRAYYPNCSRSTKCNKRRKGGIGSMSDYISWDAYGEIG